MKKELENFLKEINDGKIQKAQKKIADILGISKVSVSCWISGKTKPSDDNIMKLAKITKENPDELRKIFSLEESPDQNERNLEMQLQLKEHEIRLLRLENEILKNKLNKKIK